jgi:hypothetical protein
MSVVSLSRIQLRRGKTNGQPLPQLASGELAWAIDTRELWIGNGTIEEGASIEGNTRILTASDNIFNQSTSTSTYVYKELEIAAERSLQDRLDDYVSLRAFAGNTDSERLQTAINVLFGEFQSSIRAHTLYVEPGIYTLNLPINLLPGTRIQGAGVGRTVFRSINTTLNPVFTNSATDVVDKIYFDGITIDVSEAKPANPIRIKSTFDLIGVQFCKFSNIEIIGDPLAIDQNYGIALANNLDTGTESIFNIFENITARYCKYSVYSTHSIKNNTWKNCVFDTNTIAVFFNNSDPLVDPVQNNIIENCWFDAIEQNAIKIHKGMGNVSQNNKFYNIGNVAGVATYNIIDFGVDFGIAGNTSKHDWFQRTYDFRTLNGFTYIPEIKGNSVYDNEFKFHRTISKENGPASIDFILHVQQMQVIEVTYQYKNTQSNIFKHGTLTIIANAAATTPVYDDDYMFSGNVSDIDKINFQVIGIQTQLENPIDMMQVTVLDSTSTNADFYYSVKYIN